MMDPSGTAGEQDTEQADPIAFGARGLSTQMVTTLVEHLAWARDQYLPLLQELEEGKLKEVPAELQKGVYGSMHNTLAHMAQSEWLWLQRCRGESPLRVPKGEDFADLNAIINWWNTVHSDALQYLNVVTDGELERVVTYRTADNKRYTRKIWHMLLQVCNHQTEHRSQIATLLGSMGVQVPPTDLVVYLNYLNTQK